MVGGGDDDVGSWAARVMIIRCVAGEFTHLKDEHGTGAVGEVEG